MAPIPSQKNFSSSMNSVAVIDEEEYKMFKRAVMEFIREQKEKMESVK